MMKRHAIHSSGSEEQSLVWSEGVNIETLPLPG